MLILVANGAPIVARNLFGDGARPVDGGATGADGRRVLGRTKTWRGVVAAVVLAAAAAPALGYPLWVGAVAGAAAMAGDMFSSWVKRRLGKAPSDMAFGLDQLPEALLPAAILAPVFGLGVGAVALIGVLFVVLELALSRALFALGLRDRPY